MRIKSIVSLCCVMSMLIACSSGDDSDPVVEEPEVYFGSWTWVAGGNTINNTGSYGVMGVAATTNSPGGRYTANSWQDNQGNVWIYGGDGYGGSTARGLLNDIWRWDGSNWTWMSGTQLINQSGNYGTLGVADAANIPGARSNAVIWTDGNGNVWVFGGVGLDENGNMGWLGDLWQWDGTNWTWLSGSKLLQQTGSYGQQGVADAANLPGARTGAICWMDQNGDLWMFGGSGYAAGSTVGDLNDMWRWDGSQWTWMSGSNNINQSGNYGTKGQSASTNLPGGREWSVSWNDSTGNVWLFGGQGIDINGNRGNLNDLWRWDGSNWTWISGSNSRNTTGSYGVKGSAASGNAPGGRSEAIAWYDSQDRAWIFGGRGFDSEGRVGSLNDLWMWDGVNWTWFSGSDIQMFSGAVFGGLGVPAKDIRPGARTSSISWIDGNDNLWLFSGSGFASEATIGRLNDVWQYQPE